VTLELLRAADRPRSEWKNGGGTTSQVAGAPDGAGLEDFDWRLSIADVRTPGPFSAFDGVDRVIVLVDGAAMDLTVDGTEHRLLPHRPFAFAGEADTGCVLPAGPTRDLNVMTRRGRYRAAVDLLTVTRVATALPGADPLLVVVLSGKVEVTAADSAPARLDRLNAASSAETLTVTGDGVLAVVRLSPG